MVKPAAGHRPLAYSSPEAVQTTGTVADIGRCPGTAFTDRRDSTVHDHAEIFIAICSVFAGLDICVTVEPLDRLLKWRELGYHNALHALILVRVEHLGWTIRDEHIDILGVDRRRLLPVTLESGTVVHRLADINKIARHSMKARISAAGIARPRSASSSRIVGDLPPSSSVTRFIVAPPSRMIDSPTATEPVNEIFIHVRIAHELRPDDIPSARDDVEKALRQLGFVQSLDQHLGLQRA